MTEWVAKRFWTDVTIEEVSGGFRVLLDGRAVKSPGRRALDLPSLPMAEAMAEEWRAQTDTIDPATMPVTRSANSALDQTAPQREGVIDSLAAYGETDLLCHRATEPSALVKRQAAAWDPLLNWSAAHLRAEMAITQGILPTEQSAESLAKLRSAVANYGNFGLTGLYDLIQLSGSIIIGLAVAQARISAAEGWEVSRIDEAWQIEQWGADEEADAQCSRRQAAFFHASQFLNWSSTA